MQNKLTIMFLTVAALFISAGISSVAAQEEGQCCLKEKLSPSLQVRLQTGFSTEPVRVIVQFKKQEQDESAPELGSMSRAERMARLRQRAACSRQGFMQFIQQKIRRMMHEPNAAKGEGGVHPLWLGDCVALDLRPETIEEIASRPEVGKIFDNRVVSVPPVEAAGVIQDGDSLDLWNLDIIGLNAIDSRHLDGSGVRLGIVDTGLDSTNPDLDGKLVAWAEFDGYGNRVESEPHESHYRWHGTHVASVMVGDKTGIAPGASLLCALALPEGAGTIEQTLAALQWIIDPDNDPETNDGAQIVNMSWGTIGTSQIYQTAIANMIAAGVLPVCAIGNFGANNTLSPGNVPDAIGVGAIDSHERATSFTSGGQVYWNERCVTKPDIVAPGSFVWGIGPDGVYQTMSGTSIASPHVAAAAALLLQYRPGLGPAQLKRFLLNTSLDLGPSGRDDLYGMGRLDIPELFMFLDSYSNRISSMDLVLGMVQTIGDFQERKYVTYFSDGTTCNIGEASDTGISPDMALEPVGMADVNGDGFADLVVRRSEDVTEGGFSDSYLVYLSGNEGGLSESPVTWISSVSPEKANSLEVVGLADVNGDKRGDVVLLETIDQIYSRQLRFRVLLSKPGDYFEEAPQDWAKLFVSDYYQYEYRLGDVNGDDKADMIMVIRYADQSYSPITFAVGLSEGNSFKIPMSSWLSIPPSWVRGPMQVTALSDVDGDGMDDLVLHAEGFANTAVYVYQSNGVNRFIDGHAWCFITTGPSGGIRGVADVNRDGAADLLVDVDNYTVFEQELAVWFSDGQSRFYKAGPPWFYLPVSQGRTIDFIGFGNIGLGDWSSPN